MARAIPLLHTTFEKVPLLARPSISRHVAQFKSAVGVRRFHVSEQHNDIYMITDENDFKNKVMRNSLPVIVNFHADWCEPCHSLKPLLEKIAKENMDRIHLAEVLVDEHVELLHAFEVTAVPAVLGIQRGIVTEKFVGLVSHKQVTDFVNGLMAWQSQWTEDLRVKFSHRDLFILNKSRNNSTPEEFDLLAYIVA